MARRSVLSIVLALILVVTSQAMAVARGASDTTGQMVICVGAGTTTVYTDASGAPTAAPHICPDCLLLIATTPPTPALIFESAPNLAYLSKSRKTLCILCARHLHPQTRAPPVLA